MHSFPMFIRTTGRRVVIAGGAEQAAQKARLILKTDAEIVILAPELDPELTAIVEEGRAVWNDTAPSPEAFSDAVMVFVATGCPGADFAIHALVKAAGVPVNVVDQLELCDIITPSLVDRDPVVIAIGTEGTAPVLARRIKTEVERILAPNLGGLAAFAGRLRKDVADRVPPAQRRSFWRWVFTEEPKRIWSMGSERLAAQKIKSAIADGGAPGDPSSGAISFVDARQGRRDLLTLRAVERLQEADVIIHGQLPDPDLLELARRDSHRIFIDPQDQQTTWPDDRLRDMILSDATRGQNVVVLLSTELGQIGTVFAQPDIGHPVEFVPGAADLNRTAGTS